MLEELVGRRADEREEAMFNLGFEHGLACGRADALAARHPARDALRDQITRLVVRAGLEGPRALAALLECSHARCVRDPGGVSIQFFEGRGRPTGGPPITDADWARGGAIA